MFTQHPEVAVKARAEVLEHIGLNGTPDIQEIKKLKYRKIRLVFCLLFIS